MKIGNQSIHHLKFIPWVDKDIRLLLAGLPCALLLCGLKGTQACGAYGHHTATLLLGGLDDGRQLWWHMKHFRVHMMLFYGIHAHRRGWACAHGTSTSFLLRATSR